MSKGIRKIDLDQMESMRDEYRELQANLAGIKTLIELMEIKLRLLRSKTEEEITDMESDFKGSELDDREDRDYERFKERRANS